MELINPIGRKASNVAQPNACFCASDGGSAATNFVTGKGSDSCSNCGCYCETILGIGYNTGSYRSYATNTNRTSSL